MKTSKKRVINPNSDTTFTMIAETLGDNPQAIFECYKRALTKLKKALRRRGYKMDDFFGYVKNEH
jgi:hypothetical protein